MKTTDVGYVNKNNQKNFLYKTIVEIDPNKLDDGFFKIVRERNLLYLKRTLRNLWAVFLMAIGVILLILSQ